MKKWLLNTFLRTSFYITQMEKDDKPVISHGLVFVFETDNPREFSSDDFIKFIPKDSNPLVVCGPPDKKLPSTLITVYVYYPTDYVNGVYIYSDYKDKITFFRYRKERFGILTKMMKRIIGKRTLRTQIIIFRMISKLSIILPTYV